jgi:hypothetical protein
MLAVKCYRLLETVVERRVVHGVTAAVENQAALARKVRRTQVDAPASWKILSVISPATRREKLWTHSGRC